jgi:hypothetical protein
MIQSLLGLLALISIVHAEPPAGLRVATAGHSFHVWMPGLLNGLVKDAGITGHQQIALSSIGGSRTIQHWDAQGDKQKIKPVLMEGKADVLTLSPIFLPDAGIENFVKLGLQHNPALRITVQEFWMTCDDGSLWGKPLNGKVVDRDSKTMTDLHAAHDDYFKYGYPAVHAAVDDVLMAGVHTADDDMITVEYCSYVAGSYSREESSATPHSSYAVVLSSAPAAACSGGSRQGRVAAKREAERGGAG